MEKIQRKSEIHKLQIKFQVKEFFGFLIASLCLAGFAYLITLIPYVGGFGYILYLVVIFNPSLVGFDAYTLYEKKQIPRLLHPNRFQILVLNIFLALILAISPVLFLLGWIGILVWVFKPGSVEVEKVIYTSTNSDGS